MFFEIRARSRFGSGSGVVKQAAPGMWTDLARTATEVGFSRPSAAVRTVLWVPTGGPAPAPYSAAG
ncbi:hypothetical protein ASE09_23200 [Streptomyces sp. Root66D1]|nr:hypothetical protein ASD33_25645 [Streptomyces sp. Root1304]KRA78771.1 hypothetical protein ASE09_23200 [Streptomyces sp. Root66D1]